MNLMTCDAKYVDVLERSMYNGVLAGVSLSGDRFFYVNPLETDGTHHRKAWYRTACCPSQISRFLPSIGNYIYAKSDDEIWVNLYIDSKTKMNYRGNPIELKQITEYPWNGKVRFEITTWKTFKTGLKFRIPEWCDTYTLTYNGKQQKVSTVLGYASLEKKFRNGDVIELNLDITAKIVQADPRIKANEGKRAVQRGPLVYCLEEVDNPDIDNVAITSQMIFTTSMNSKLAVMELTGKDASGSILRFVPYSVWDNREGGKMKVWVNYQE